MYPYTIDTRQNSSEKVDFLPFGLEVTDSNGAIMSLVDMTSSRGGKLLTNLICGGLLMAADFLPMMTSSFLSSFLLAVPLFPHSSPAILFGAWCSGYHNASGVWHISFPGVETIFNVSPVVIHLSVPVLLKVHVGAQPTSIGESTALCG